MPPIKSPESITDRNSEFNPELSFMDQALRIVIPSLVAKQTQASHEQKMAEQAIDECYAEELRH